MNVFFFLLLWLVTVCLAWTCYNGMLSHLFRQWAAEYQLR